MDNDVSFDTFFFISSKKLSISVTNKFNFEKIYNKEILINNDLNQINFDELNNFLDKNIFKIEKVIKNFIKNIYLIVDCDEFFPVELSIKKNNYGNLILPKNLSYVLNEAKDQCKKTFRDKKIVHLLIENYYIDEEYFSYLPKDLKCKNFSLDLKFICLSNNLINNLEKTLKRYQISLNKIISAAYIKNFITNEDEDMFKLSKKIIEGYNENEVLLVDKNIKNQGFFEKFFNFFS